MSEPAETYSDLASYLRRLSTAHQKQIVDISHLAGKGKAFKFWSGFSLLPFCGSSGWPNKAGKGQF